MDHAYESGAIGTPPPTPTSIGFPTDGDLGSATPPTVPGAGWAHMLTTELLNVITAAGITPSAATLNQLLSALDARYAAGGTSVHVTDFTGANQSLGSPGYQKFPGGLIVQWGQGADSGAEPLTTFPIAFPHANFSVSLTHAGPSGSALAEAPEVITPMFLTGYTSRNQNGSSSPHNYIAIGY